MALYLVNQNLSFGSYYLQSPEARGPRAATVLVGLMCSFSAVVLLARYVRRRIRYHRSGGRHGLAPTPAFYRVLNTFFGHSSVIALAHGIFIAFVDHLTGSALYQIFRGIAFGMPLMIVKLVGRDAMFQAMARRFHLNP